jgi:zinc protease
MRAILLKLLLLALCAGVALAVPAAQKVFPYNYSQDDLPNGLRLVTIPTDYPNIVALYVVVQTGSRNEVEPGKTGFAHLFEHMMFRGTEKYPPDKYQGVLTAAGASSNASTTDDFTNYYTTFSKEDLEKILEMEADRFQNLKYSEAVFRTESLAVLGEYNKNSANPVSKLSEVQQDTAFTTHTYKHTTMGFLKDIQDMPNQYNYSLQFFDRYYRPEYTTIIVAGDVTREQVKPLVEKYWGNWKRGNYKAQVPAEPPQQGPRQNSVKWPTPTLPYVAVSYRIPAYTDTEKTSAALSVLSSLAFSPTSDLYQKLVIREQKVDALRGAPGMNVDPSLFTIMARVKKESDMKGVEDDILATVKTFAETPVAKERLEAVKSNLRYSFALSMSTSDAVAATVVRFVALRRTPETINRLFDMYSQVTPEDVQNAARQYLLERGRTIVTLTSGGGNQR